MESINLWNSNHYDDLIAWNLHESCKLACFDKVEDYE